MIKVKDGYGKLIGTTYQGSANHLLRSNGDTWEVHTGKNNEANKIVRTDGSGYLQTGWISTTSGDMGTTSINRVYCSNDSYIRYKTPANFFSSLTNNGDNLSITIASQNRTLTVLYARIADLLRSKGTIAPQTGRTLNLGDVYSYHLNTSVSGGPTTNAAVIGFGRGTSGTVEIAGEWTSGRGLWVRALRDTTDNWYAWDKVLTQTTYTGITDSRYYTKTLADERFVNVTDFARLEIGGRNFYHSKTRLDWVDHTFGTLNNRNNNGFNITTDETLLGAVLRLYRVLQGNGWHTMSGYVKHNQPYNANLVIQFADKNAKTIQVNDVEQYFEISYNVTNYTANIYHFIDLEFSGWLTYSFRDIKVEQGNKATDWTPAPEDQVSDWNTIDVNSFSFIKNKPTTFKPILTTSTDWNAKFVDSEWGFFTGSGNSPVSGSSVMGISIPLVTSANYGMQLAGRNRILYFRTKENGTIQPWYTVLHSGNSSLSGTTVKINGVSATFSLSSHTHTLDKITDLHANWGALLKVAPSTYVTRWPTWGEVTGKPNITTGYDLGVNRYHLVASKTKHPVIKNISGNAIKIGDEGQFLIHLITKSTSIDTGYAAVIGTDSNHKWVLNEIYRRRSNSNQPTIFIDSDGLPKIRTEHSTDYTIEVLIRGFQGSGSPASAFSYYTSLAGLINGNCTFYGTSLKPVSNNSPDLITQAGGHELLLGREGVNKVVWREWGRKWEFRSGESNGDLLDVEFNSGQVTASSFIKKGVNNNYVLLGGGGHKAISDFATKSHSHSEYVTLKGDQELNGIKSFIGSERSWVRVGVANDSRVITSGIGGVDSLASLKAAIGFKWFETEWQIGNIRNGSSGTNGFGITKGNNNLVMRVNENGLYAKEFFGNLKWEKVTNKPTTIAGYGITDALTTSNYTNYTVTKTGTGASGTWGINITGNAQSASKLANARTIWGQSFDGIKNVDGVLNVVGSTGFCEGIRIHSVEGISSIWLNAKTNSGYDAGMFGITADSSGLRFRYGSGSSPSDVTNISRGGVVKSTGKMISAGFQRSGSSDSYILLGGGGHKAISDFAVKSHNHIFKSLIGAHVLLGEGKNLDDYTDIGFRASASTAAVQSMVNSPTKDAFSMLVFQRSSAEWVTQMLITSTNSMFIRNKSSSWGSWIKMATEEWSKSEFLTKTDTDKLYKPVEPTRFVLQTNYVGVRTPGRKSNQYYEFWDSVGWAGIHMGESKVNGNLVITGKLTTGIITRGNLTIGENGNEINSSNGLYLGYRNTKKVVVGNNNECFLEVRGNETITGNSTATNFIKKGSSDSYVLLGGGGHKAVSDFAVKNHNHNSLYVTALGTSGNYVTWTKNGTTNNLTVPYATKASYVTLTYCRDDSSPSNKGLWNTIKNGTSSPQTNKVNFYTIYASAEGPSTFGEMMEILSYNSNHWLPLLWFGSGKSGNIYYRNKDYNNNTWGAWLTILTNINYSAILDARYVNVTGDTMTGALKFNLNNNGNANVGGGDGFKLFYNHTTGSNFPELYSNVASFLTGYTGFQLASQGGGGQTLWFRKRQDNGTWHPWHSVLHTGNYTTTLDGRYVNITGDTMTGALNMNGRLIINPNGYISPTSTYTRRSGMYGVYDSYKTSHIWSMGASYVIPEDGSTFGNLYGFAYKHTNNTTGGTMGGSHMAVWCINGVPKASFGDYIWAVNGFKKNGSSNSYVLLGGGGHKAVSDFSMAHSHPYLPLSGGTVTGITNFTNRIRIVGTVATPAWNSVGITFTENTTDAQAVSFIYTSYDTYRAPAGIKLIGNQGNEWFEAPKIYATTFYGSLSGNATSATNSDKLDGYHASSFLQNFNVGNVNFNTLTTSGVYRLSYTTTNGASNGPTGADWSQMLVMHGGGDTIAQMAISYSSRRVYVRAGNPSNVGGSGSWSSWYTLAFTTDVPTVTNYYWANIKVSASSSTSTSPTFSTAYTSNWFRSTGNTGWYSETYGGGWNMTDTTYIRAYGSKRVYTANTSLYAFYTSGGMTAAKGFWHSAVNSNSYVLLAGGSYKAVSDFATKSHTHSYVPLSGNSTITISKFYGLTLKRSDSNGSAIQFSNSAGALAGIGVLSDKSFVVSSGSTTAGNMFKVTSAGKAYAGGTELSKVGHTHSYLPLAGGTMTGGITWKNGASIAYNGNCTFNDLNVSHVTLNSTTLNTKVYSGTDSVKMDTFPQRSVVCTNPGTRGATVVLPGYFPETIKTGDIVVITFLKGSHGCISTPTETSLINGYGRTVGVGVKGETYILMYVEVSSTDTHWVIISHP